MNIYEVPKNRRYWVVRADGGSFYDHFIRHEIVAIGHLTDYDIGNCASFIPEENELKSILAKKEKLSSSDKRRESVLYNQVRTFIYDLSIHDWVITVGHKALRFGIIKSEPYILNKAETVIQDLYGSSRKVMNYNLRRDVEWGPAIARDSIPYGLARSLRANQSIFNLDKHWQAIYHSLYPAFSYEDHLYLSLKIRSDNEINNFNVVQLLSFLNEIELIANEIDSDLSIGNFQNLFDEYSRNNRFTLTTKAQFYSPGDIWNKINFKGKNGKMAYALIAYSMLFGNQHAGMDGIFDLETRQKLWDIIVERLKTKDLDGIASDLKLGKPNYVTAVLESKDRELTNQSSRPPLASAD